jgi:hypothetical protein
MTVNIMSTRTARKLPSRKFKPGMALLEERCTPAVTAVSVFGVAPGLGGAPTVTIGGLVRESTAAAASTLTLNYTVTDSQGNLLASGPLTPQQVPPGTVAIPFNTTIPISVPRGNAETISVNATDSDSMGVPLAATATLFISPSSNLSTLGVGSSQSNGDRFSGNGQGQFKPTQSATTGLVIKGNGIFKISSYPHNQLQLFATMTSKFQFGIDPQGNVSLISNKGRDVLNVGSYAGGPASGGGFSARLAGNLTMTRFANSTIRSQFKGSVGLSIQFASASATSAPSTVQGTGRNIAITVTTDTTGNLTFNATGNVNLFGQLSASSLSGLGLSG